MKNFISLICVFPFIESCQNSNSPSNDTIPDNIKHPSIGLATYDGIVTCERKKIQMERNDIPIDPTKEERHRDTSANANSIIKTSQPRRDLIIGRGSSAGIQG